MRSRHINSNIITTKAPKNLINKGMASNNLLSHVISLKFLYAVPLYRQENYFNMLGATLSRQTLSNWVIGVAAELTDVYNLMKEEYSIRGSIRCSKRNCRRDRKSRR